MRNYRKKAVKLCALVCVVICICLVYGYCEARNIVVRKHILSDKDIPASFVGKKLVFVSDIHCNQYFTPSDVAALVSRINRLNPDIILLGGDNVDRDSQYSTPFFEEIAKLKSVYGVFSVLGNHDHWEDAELIQKGLSDCGFNICDNKSYWIKEGNDSIKIGGVGELWEDVQIPANTTGDVLPQDFCILLSHNPEYMELLDNSQKCVDLMLSGHMHAGQITLLGLWAPVLPKIKTESRYNDPGQKYRYGWVREKDIELYITSGIGMGKTPFRFFARPEIVEITLAN